MCLFSACFNQSSAYGGLTWALGREGIILSVDAFHLTPPLKFQVPRRFIHLPPSPPHTFPSSFFFFHVHIQTMYKWRGSCLGRRGKHCRSLFFHQKLHIRSKFAKVLLAPGHVLEVKLKSLNKHSALFFFSFLEGIKFAQWSVI